MRVADREIPTRLAAVAPRRRFAVLGIYEQLALHPETRTLSLLVSAPIALHPTAILTLGPDANTVRARGIDPDPHCTVAVLPVARPSHPDTDEIALARAYLAGLETLQARGDLAAIGPEIELRASQIAAAARDDRVATLAPAPTLQEGPCRDN